MTDPFQLTAGTHDEFVDLIRAVKEHRQLSDKWFDDNWLSPGWCNKLLGPTRERNLGKQATDAFLIGLGVRIRLENDPAQIARMEALWERRHGNCVNAVPNRVSKALIERVGPAVFKASGKAGAAARMAMLTPEHRSRIARNAAKQRWKRARARRKEEAANA